MTRVSGSEADGRCGTCAAFVRVRTVPPLGRVGECALEVFPPPVRATSACSRYRPKGAAAPPAPPRAAGEPRGRRNAARPPADRPRPPSDALRLPDAAATIRSTALPTEIELDMDMDDFRRVLRQVLNEELGLRDVEIA